MSTENKEANRAADVRKNINHLTSTIEEKKRLMVVDSGLWWLVVVVDGSLWWFMVVGGG